MKKLFIALLLMSIVISLASCDILLPLITPPVDDCAEGHTWGDYSVVAEASCTEAGKQSRTCSVCGEVEEAEIPLAEHAYGTELKYDENNHWNECSACEDKANVSAHSFGAWVVVTEPTYTETGLKKQSCECGYFVEATIDTLVGVSGIELNKTSAQLVLNGSTEQSMVELVATVLPENAENKNFTWESTNPDVAYVLNGQVYAMGLGTCEIKAVTENGGYSASCQITVINEAESVSLSGGGSVVLNGTLNLTATVLPENAADKSVVWQSSNENILKVEDGVVTAVGAGKATITVTTANGKTASVEISVIEANIDANVNDSIYSGLTPYNWELNNYVGDGKTHNIGQQTQIYFGKDGLYLAIVVQDSDAHDYHVASGTKYEEARLETYLMFGETPTTTNTYSIRFYVHEDSTFTYRFFSFAGDTTAWSWTEKAASIIYSKSIDENGYVVEAFVPYSDLKLEAKPATVNLLTALVHRPEGAGSGNFYNYGTYSKLYNKYETLHAYDINNYIQYNANGVVFKGITVDNLSLDATNLVDGKYEATFTVDYLYGQNSALGATFTGNGAAFITEVGNGVYKISIPEANVADFAEAQIIKVVSAGFEKEISLVVTPLVLPTSVEISGASSNILLVGGTLNLTATVLPADATDKSVVWQSSNESVLKVENGVVTAVGAGKATITVTASNGVSTSLEISVLEAAIDANVNDSIYSGLTPYNWELNNYLGHDKIHNVSQQTQIYFGKDGLYIAIVAQDADAHDYYVSPNTEAKLETFFMFGDTPTKTNTYSIRFYVHEDSTFTYRFYSFAGDTTKWSWTEIKTASIVYSKTIDENGYVVEAFVPYSDLKLDAKPETVNLLTAFVHRPEGPGSGNFMSYGTYDQLYVAYGDVHPYNVNNYIQYNANGVVYKQISVDGNFTLDATNIAENGNYETTFALDLLYGITPAVGVNFTGAGAEFITEVGNGVYKISIPAANADDFAEGLTVKLACAGLEKEITISVVAEVLPSSVEISGGKDAVVKVGSTLNLTATLLPGNAFNPNVVWTSSDDSIATVVNGVVTALKEGVVTITAASERDNSISDSYTIAVLAPTVEMNFDNSKDRLENTGSDSSISASANKLNNPTGKSDYFVDFDSFDITTGADGTGSAIKINHNTGPYPVMNKALGSGDFTISLNFNINGNNASGGSGKYLFGTVQPDAGAEGFSVVLRNNTIRFKYNDGGAAFITVSLGMSDVAWHNITLTRKDDTLTIFYDGVSVGTYKIDANRSYGAVAFGAYYGQGDWGYVNQTFYLDDVMFFDKALTADQVSAKNFADLAPTVKMTFDNSNNRLENSGSDSSITASPKILNSEKKSTSFVDVRVATGASGSGSALQINHQKGPHIVMSNTLGASDFTISVNFNINGIEMDSTGSGRYLFGTAHPDATDGFSVVYRLNTIRFRFDSNSKFITVALPSKDAAWHNVTLTRKGTTLTIYLDGASIGTYEIDASKSYGKVAFGAYYGMGSAYKDMTISIDDVMFFDRALSKDEVSVVAKRYN